MILLRKMVKSTIMRIILQNIRKLESIFCSYEGKFKIDLVLEGLGDENKMPLKIYNRKFNT